MPIYQAMESIPQMGDLQLPFDDAVKKLEGLVGFNFQLDQQRAPKELHIGVLKHLWEHRQNATLVKKMEGRYLYIILINIYLVGVARYAEVDLQPLKKD